MPKVISSPALFPELDLFPSEELFPRSATFFENTQILHLFEFELKSLDGLTSEVIRFTDNDLFVTADENLYTPISISFNEIREDFTLQADEVSLTIDNIGQEITADALTKEWRNNQARIFRITYDELPQSSQLDIDASTLPADNLYPADTLFPKELNASFENGIFSFDDGYPSLNFDKESYLNRFNKDLIFEGLIDDFRGGSGSASITIASVLSVWDSPYPAETFDQGKYKDMIGAMTLKLDWGAL